MAERPTIQIGLRVRLARGTRDHAGKDPDPYAYWCGGRVKVGELGTIALATKSNNQLFSERVRQYPQPDRPCVIWDSLGAVPMEHHKHSKEKPEAAFLRRDDDQNWQFCIQGAVGDYLPDYLEPAPPEALSKHTVTLAFGGSEEAQDQTQQAFAFDTKMELDAFMQGVEAASGWMDYEVIEDEQSTGACGEVSEEVGRGGPGVSGDPQVVRPDEGASGG